jgi:hypothetical protein
VLTSCASSALKYDKTEELKKNKEFDESVKIVKPTEVPDEAEPSVVTPSGHAAPSPTPHPKAAPTPVPKKTPEPKKSKKETKAKAGAPCGSSA